MKRKETTLEELTKSGKIIYEYIGGSYAYGTNTPESDMDIMGVYFVSPEEYISLFEPQVRISDPNNNITYYSLKRFFDLLKTANPNVIEGLFIPSDCVKINKAPIMCEMLQNRHLFLSKQTYFTHASYAAQQIKKAKGKNKKVHNPAAKTMPVKEDFCWIVDDSQYLSTNKMSFRPKPIKETDVDLSEYHVSSMEHAPFMYRLYHYGKKAKGVFRGNDMLVCESIPKEDELTHISGLLIYNKEAYDKALREWRSYWDWVKNRNDARWIDQEKGLVDFDAKNMMHCLRLMMSCENIFTNGEPMVRMEGENLNKLLKIRRGEVEYDAIMAEVEEKEAKLKRLYETCTSLPEEADVEKLEELYQHLMYIGSKTL